MKTAPEKTAPAIAFARMTNAGKWRYRLTQTLWVETLEECPAAFQNKWLSVNARGQEPGSIIGVTAGYSWDGCTVVPDLGGTMAASCVHDAVYQFAEDLAKQWGRSVNRTLRWGDDVFLDTMRQDGFGAAGLYYAGVRLLGGPAHWINKHCRLW